MTSSRALAALGMCTAHGLENGKGKKDILPVQSNSHSIGTRVTNRKNIKMQYLIVSNNLPFGWITMSFTVNF